MTATADDLGTWSPVRFGWPSKLSSERTVRMDQSAASLDGLVLVLCWFPL